MNEYVLRNRLRTYFVENGVTSIYFPRTKGVYKIRSVKSSDLLLDNDLDVFVRWAAVEELDSDTAISILKDNLMSVKDLTSLKGAIMHKAIEKNIVGYLCTEEFLVITEEMLKSFKKSSEYKRAKSIENKLCDESKKVVHKMSFIKNFTSSLEIVIAYIGFGGLFLALVATCISGLLAITIGIIDVSILSVLLLVLATFGNAEAKCVPLRTEYRLLEKRLDRETYRGILNWIS